MKNICRFELHGRCSKLDCDAQHLRDSAKISLERVLKELKDYSRLNVEISDVSTREGPGSPPDGGSISLTAQDDREEAVRIAANIVRGQLRATGDSRLPFAPPCDR